jgi:cholest-4-en-3-one 26-monooxygenase
VASVTDVDLTDFANYKDGVPYDVYDDMRRRDPVLLQDTQIGRLWSVTGLEELRLMVRDPQTFSSTDTVLFFDMPEEREADLASMINMDPPKHDRIRGIVNRGFTPVYIARLENEIRKIVRELIEEAREKDRFEFIEDLGLMLPVMVIAQILGIPAVDRRAFVQWSVDLLGDRSSPEAAKRAVMARQAIYALARELAEEKQANPGDDVTSQILSAMDNEVLTTEEYQSFFELLLIGGFETTRNLVAQGTIRLLTEPDLLADIATDQSLIPPFLEEVVRFYSPIVGMKRIVTKDVDWHGRKMQAGDRVGLWFAAANRDPAAFNEPHVFDARRSPNGHVAYGAGGPHHCIGAPLARLEGRVFFEEFGPLLRTLKYDGDIVYNANPQMATVVKIPLRWHNN